MKNRMLKIWLLLVTLAAACLLLAGCGAKNAGPADTGAQASNEQGGQSATQAADNTCTVTFDAQEYMQIEAQQVKQGDRVQRPQDPVRAGYTFAGWTYSGETWGFIKNTVTGNMTLVAAWMPQLLVSPEGVLTGLTEAGKSAEIIEIPETYNGVTITGIGSSAFSGCTGLTSITIPDSVKSIGERAFYYCIGLTSITIPDSVTGIGYDAFYGCTGLTSITIGSSVTSIGSYAFCYCTSLKSITVAEGNTVYHSTGNCLIKTTSKTLIAGCKTSVIPADGSVTSIGDWAFDNCTIARALQASPYRIA